MLSACPPHAAAADDEKPSLNFDDETYTRFAHTGLVDGRDGRGLHHNTDRFTVFVGNGASDQLVNDELTLGLRTIA